MKTVTAELFLLLVDLRSKEVIVFSCIFMRGFYQAPKNIPNPLVTKMALVKLNSQNKTKSHEFENMIKMA